MYDGIVVWPGPEHDRMKKCLFRRPGPLEMCAIDRYRGQIVNTDGSEAASRWGDQDSCADADADVARAAVSDASGEKRSCGCDDSCARFGFPSFSLCCLTF